MLSEGYHYNLIQFHAVFFELGQPFETLFTSLLLFYGCKDLYGDFVQLLEFGY